MPLAPNFNACDTFFFIALLKETLLSSLQGDILCHKLGINLRSFDFSYIEDYFFVGNPLKFSLEIFYFGAFSSDDKSGP